ncbi:MAG: nuoB2 [Frankiales bacterium]|nr:nuoB2 [Frankiales bacterium]
MSALDPVRLVLDWGPRLRLSVFDVGLACCAVEFVAASMSGQVPHAGGPGDADVLVISGTVTDKLAPAVRRLYDAMPEPRYVISMGSCANSGGPYWDSYSVTKGVDQLIPVDVYVPGCPPRPEALLHGLQQLASRVTQPAAVRPVTGSAPLVGPPGGVRGPQDLRP